ncbi:low affinity immunoglobulin gamma Fc region receptor II-a-like [Centropristis striata]|uniref:low affinity immunoglobulin gamma Fc region receptor II-a-like n=1 Tax=Centropristis striata TaxID=184440 RepID=UPI0027E13026|nr:low affinity immunoglobulin gamma Fc region receptor II-a-like [Centropristis striata]
MTQRLIYINDAPVTVAPASAPTSEITCTGRGSCQPLLKSSFSVMLRQSAARQHGVLLEFTLLNSHTLKSDAAFSITPNRLQHFQFDTVSFHCEGSDGLSKLRMMKNSEESDPECDIETTTSCTIQRAYPSDNGEYWCENNRVNISVTAGSVILESPVLPVMEGHNVTLSCRNKTTSTNLQADFFKDGRLIMTSISAETTIKNVSKSDEGLYRCSISGGGGSAESWLAVRETRPSLDHSIYLLLLLRTVFIIVMVALLLLLVGLLHCYTHSYTKITETQTRQMLVII